MKKLNNKNKKVKLTDEDENSLANTNEDLKSSDDVYSDNMRDENCDLENESFDTNLKIRPPLSKLGRIVKEMEIMSSGSVPKVGHGFKSGQLRKAGNFLLGPILGSSPVRSMVQCLGRKKGTDEFYTLKILTVRQSVEESQDDKQGKMLLHTEHSLLSFLNGQPGILKEHGLFEDYACDGTYNTDERKLVGNGKIVRRICLVLDCVIPHSFNSNSSDYINLQHYVIGKRKLKELDALTIFYSIVSVVESLHDLNVIHRDLKLANLVLNKRNRQIILTNFCLGQHLVSETDKLLDQRGSPAYISPDVLIGKPYLGKPSDMWALGVVLYTMLFGQFPFYHKFHQELFKMIKTAQYTIPNDGGVKHDTLEVIQGLLCLDPLKRSSAKDVLIQLTTVITTRLTPETFTSQDAQVVPDFPLTKEDEDDHKETPKKTLIFGGRHELGSNDRDCNLLDYLMHRAVPHPENSHEKKVPHAFGNPSSATRNSLNYCYTTMNGEISGGTSTVSKSVAMSIIEGDLRSFTQTDLFTHRSIFPFSGPELFGGWRSPSSGPPPIPSSSTVTGSPSTRALSRVGPPPSTLRMPPSRLSLPSLHIPPSSGTPNMYEFPPSRWALAVLQQINNSSTKAPAVPQTDNPSGDSPTPSTSGMGSDPSSTQTPGDSTKSAESASSASGTSGSANKSVTFAAGDNPPRESGDVGTSGEQPGPSSRYPSDSSPGIRNPGNRPPPKSKMPLSSLALRRMKKSHSKLSSKSTLSLRLRMSSSDSDTSSNSSCNSLSNSSSNQSSSAGAANEAALNPVYRNTLTSFTSFGQQNPPASASNAPEDVNMLPIDANNNNDDNNNNSDDNNNSDNNNLNVNNNFVHSLPHDHTYTENRFQEGD